MNNYELAYQGSLQQVENSIVNTLEEWQFPSESDIKSIAKSTSALDAWDYCYAIAIGMAGVFIATNEAFGQYLEQIHNVASGASGDYDRFQSFLGDALRHRGGSYRCYRNAVQEQKRRKRLLRFSQITVGA